MDRVEYETLIIQDLLNYYKNDELNINPWYQRRSVWTQPQKAYLINTLFEQKPVPSIYIRHSLDLEKEKSIREIVDGQQRVRAILEYIDNAFAVKHPSYPKKIKYSQLKRTDIERFKLTSLSVGYLLGATDEDVIEIFGRLNSVAKTLNSQEKRNAGYSGEYKQFCLRQATMRLAMWRELGIFSSTNIARMDEIQFISDLTYNFLNGLSDASAQKLDKIYAQYDEEFVREKEIEARFEKVFSQIACLIPEAIKDTAFKRSTLFFSLCIVLDSAPDKLPTGQIESALYKIDENFSSDIPIAKRSKLDTEFYLACTATTQRIAQRTVRDSYIRMHLDL